MLQGSIRGLREDRNRHDERMQQLNLQKQQLNAQMNDPRRLLEIQKAREEMKPGEISLGENFGQFNDPLKKEFFNRYTRPAISNVLDDEGIELNDKNEPVYKGTNTLAKLPLWKRRAIESEVALAGMGAQIGHNEIDMKIDMMQDDITKREQELGGYKPAKAKIYGPQLKAKRAELEALKVKRDDPDETINRLMDANQKINRMRKMAMSNPDINDKFYSRLNQAQDAHNAELKTLLAGSRKAQDIAEVTYFKRGDNGEMITRSVYMPKLEAANAPTSRTYDDGEFTLGRSKIVADTGSGAKGDKPLTPTTKTGVIAKVRKSLNALAAVELKDQSFDRIANMLRKGDPDMSTEDIQNTVEMIRTTPEAAAQNWKQELAAYDHLFGRHEWYKKVRGTSEKSGESESPSIMLKGGTKANPLGFKKR